jgi:hypothetical protein
MNVSLAPEVQLALTPPLAPLCSAVTGAASDGSVQGATRNDP